MPTPAKSVQFRSIDQVCEAYRNREVPAFAIWCGKQFMFKYEGDSLEEGEQSLLTWCEMLQTNQSSAIYSVYVYEDIPNGKIKDNTPYDGSFNFKLIDTPAGYLPPQYYGQYQQAGGNVKVLLDKMNAMQQEIDSLKNGDGEEEEEEQGLGKVLGVIGQLAEHPVIGPMLLPLVERLTSRLADGLLGKEEAPVKDFTLSKAKISGVEFSETDQRIVGAVNRLAACAVVGNELPELLEKLAKMAEEKPQLFSFYKSMLMKMKV